MPSFAVLLSLLNRMHATVVESIILEAEARLSQALRQRGGAAPGFGSSPNMNVKTILRLYCSLALLGVVTAASAVQQLQAFVDVAAQVATAPDTVMRDGEGADGSSARCWQPYTDFLVEAVVLALPWAVHVLRDGARAQLEGLMRSIDEYLDRRPCQVRCARLPWPALWACLA